jgi:ADP-ribosylglycohydrolase
MQHTYIVLAGLLCFSGCFTEKKQAEKPCTLPTPDYSKSLTYEQRVTGAIIGATLGATLANQARPQNQEKPLDFSFIPTLKFALQAKQEGWSAQNFQDTVATYYKENMTQDALGGKSPEGEVLLATWPLALVFPDEIPLLTRMTDYQVRLLNDHPIARGAAVAFAVGLAHALHNVHQFAIARAMTRTAATFMTLEQPYRLQAKRLHGKTPPTIDQFKNNLLLTTDVIRYGGGQGGGKGLNHPAPEKILGTVNDAQANLRSPQGFLLGFAADEAVGAALYIFFRHRDDLMAGITEGAQSPGNNVVIATLVGALIGAYSGVPEGLDLAKLENREELFVLAHEIAQLQVPA